MFKKIKNWMAQRKLNKLLKRAGMNIYQYNTRAVRATPNDEHRRVIVGPCMRFDHLWDDCITLGLMLKPGESEITPVTLSPARARIIAIHLNELADYFEKQGGAMNIDEDIT
jgi:hypothetical protein